MKVVPIVNENDTISVSEIRFGDNDTLSAITAGMIHADYLFLMTDVDCLYTDNPRSNPDAKPVLVVDDIAALEERGKKLPKKGTGPKEKKAILICIPNSPLPRDYKHSRTQLPFNFCSC